MGIEREAKLTASADLRLPELDGLVPGASVTAAAAGRLSAAYYDTDGFDLARWGITLRHRTGEDGPAWTLKLPVRQQGSTLRRRELGFEGSPGTIPAAARDLVRPYVRGRRLVRVARLSTDRETRAVHDARGRPLAEIVDDRVTVRRGREPVESFREAEIEILATGRRGDKFLAAAVERLVEAGFEAGTPLPKLVRALGPRAMEPPEIVVRKLRRDATVEQLVRHAIARSVVQMLRHDPGVRLGEDVEDVHQFRVGTRRLRSDLRTFAPVLHPAARDLRDELRWLGGVVGAVRDTDVLGERLRKEATALSAADAAGLQELLAVLADQAAAAREAMLAAMRSLRYTALLTTLVEAANTPPIATDRAREAARPASEAAAGFVRRPWRRLADAAAALGPDPADQALHDLRIVVKRCRYAAEAVAPVSERRVARFADALADLQEVLGDHHDAAVAEQWLRRTAVRVPGGALAAGALIAYQTMRHADLRTGWETAWKVAGAPKLHAWITRA